MLGHLLHRGHEQQGNDAEHAGHGAGEPDPRQVSRTRYVWGEIPEEQLGHVLA